METNERKQNQRQPLSKVGGGGNPPPAPGSFQQVAQGEDLSSELPPYGYWNIQFFQVKKIIKKHVDYSIPMCRSFPKAESGYVRLELEVPRSASIGVYARRNALPTHTNYDIAEVVRGFEDRLAKRGIKVTGDFF